MNFKQFFIFVDINNYERYTQYTYPSIFTQSNYMDKIDAKRNKKRKHKEIDNNPLVKLHARKKYNSG